MSRYHRITVAAVGIALILAGTARAARRKVPPPPAGGKTEMLWPDDTPDLKGVEEKDRPALTAFLAPKEKAAGTAVVICPGGVYGFLAMDH